MAQTKEQKKQVVESLKEKIARQKALIFVNFSGLKVKDLFELRKRLKKANSEIFVVKKTLMKLAFKEEKIKVDPEDIEGEIALVFGYEDELVPPKILYQFSQINQNIEILGGLIESQKDEFLSAEKIITLGQLPSREELLAKIVGSLSAPISQFASVLQGNIKGLVYALSAIKK